VQLMLRALQFEVPSHGVQLIVFASTHVGGAGLHADPPSMAEPPQQWNTQIWFAVHVVEPQVTLPASGIDGWQPASSAH
jgi:hypothetical protein